MKSIPLSELSPKPSKVTAKLFPGSVRISGARGVIHARAKLSNNYKPSGLAPTFSSCRLARNIYHSRQNSSDAVCRYKTRLFARTTTEAVKGCHGEAFSRL